MIRAQNRRIEIYVLKDAYQKQAADERQKWLQEKADWEEKKKKAEEDAKAGTPAEPTVGS